MDFQEIAKINYYDASYALLEMQTQTAAEYSAGRSAVVVNDAVSLPH